MYLCTDIELEQIDYFLDEPTKQTYFIVVPYDVCH